MWLLSMMTILHYYWFYLFVRIITNYKKTGEGEDLQNKAETSKIEPNKKKD